MERIPITYKLRIMLSREENTFFSIGVLRLLLKSDEYGSLRAAAQEMGMSYSKALHIIKKAESELGFTLLDRSAGGAGGGSSHLSEAGRSFVGRYLKMEEEAHGFVDYLVKKYFPEE